MRAPAFSRGYWLRTSASAARLPHARLAGPRAAHADVVFPTCPGCGVATSPVFRIDFRAAPFDALALWPTTLVALICHNRCDAHGPAYRAGSCRWWDHGDPLRPTELDAAAVRSEPSLLRAGHDELLATLRAHGRDEAYLASIPRPTLLAGIDDYEFEETSVVIVPRREDDDADVIDPSSRVGGEPAWLQRDLREEADGTVVDADPDPPRCPRCAALTALLVQWSETGMDRIPRRVRRVAGGFQPDGACVLGNPYVRFWFGCSACRLVASVAQSD